MRSETGASLELGESVPQVISDELILGEGERPPLPGPSVEHIITHGTSHGLLPVRGSATKQKSSYEKGEDDFDRDYLNGRETENGVIGAGTEDDELRLDQLKSLSLSFV